MLQFGCIGGNLKLTSELTRRTLLDSGLGGNGPNKQVLTIETPFLLQGIVKVGPGKVYGANSGPTVHRTYGAGFLGKGVIDGVNYVESLRQHPGEWDSEYHNCVHETVLTGKATGIPLPLSGTSPERFGFNLPPDSD